jgi:hypothetical protein
MVSMDDKNKKELRSFLLKDFIVEVLFWVIIYVVYRARTFSESLWDLEKMVIAILGAILIMAKAITFLGRLVIRSDIK